ncbi:autophagy-related protein 18a-like isoform X1 [Triticum dicoccoides]|nr:autophagy-related protein 18a-like isoform X1 [Triticum dicoccoides]
MGSTDPPGAERRRPAPPPPSPIVHLSFSSDASCFVVAGTSSVHWLSCDTFGLRGLYQEKDARKTIAAAAGDMLSLKESACATMSCVDSTKFFIRRWKPGYMNYHWRYFEGEKTYTGGEDDVRAVRVHGAKTVVVLVDRLEVLGCRTKDTEDKELWLLHSVVTGGNPLGLCAVSPGAPFTFACPGARDGEVHVERWEDKGEVAGSVVAIRAHSSRLASIAMSCDGRLVATASVRGTLVRVFSATDGALLQELRRGRDGADIHCIAFSPDLKWLAVSSDKATVHVFSVNVDLPSLTPEDSNGPGGLLAAPAPSSPAVATANKRSSLSFAGGFLPGYFSSEWSSTQIRVPEGTKYLVAFSSQPNTLLILGINGRFYRCRFDPEKGGVVDVRHKGTPCGSEEQDVECINFMNPSKKTSNSKPSYGS